MTRHPRSHASRRRPAVLLALSLVLAPGAGAAAAEPHRAASRLQPSDFTYLGAFKLPPVDTGLPAVWDWGGAAMTYYPAGDPGGGGDAFPGSLYATGLDTENYVSEISIPPPSTSRDLGALDAAATLQQLADVRQGLFADYNELPRVGIEYLPAQAGQAAEHLHLAWGQHFHDDPLLNIGPTHAWCDLDLENPNTRGAWWIGEPAYDRANGRLYVPELFADEYRPLIHVFRVEAGAVPETHALTVTRSGTGGGTVTSDPAGISCGGDCSHDYSAGTAVTLVATPAAGSTFGGWSGGCSGTGACVVTMDAERTVGARFDADAAGCVPGPADLCLSGNRFRVAVDWRDFSGNAGSGQVVPFGSADSGLFWFFDADNWEMLVKVLDGCGFNGSFWVFSAATTNVEYTLRVTDTESGAVRTYMNPLGNAAAALTDTAAFACP